MMPKTYIGTELRRSAAQFLHREVRNIRVCHVSEKYRPTPE